MGRRISKEFLHPSILEGINAKIGELPFLETDSKRNIVEAINELVDSLDKTKEPENRLKSILESKGIDTSDSKDLLDLIDKINNLAIVKSIEVGDNYILHTNPSYYSLPNGLRLIDEFEHEFFEGGYRASINLGGASNYSNIGSTGYYTSYTLYYNIQHIRNNEVINQITNSVRVEQETTLDTIVHMDIDNLQPGDIIKFYAGNSETYSEETGTLTPNETHTNLNPWVGCCQVKCNMIF